MSRGWFLKSCRNYSTKFNGRLRTVRVNFIRTHHVRRIKAYDQQSRRFFFPESCVRQFAETSGKETFTAWAWKWEFCARRCTGGFHYRGLLRLLSRLCLVVPSTPA
jgi:hypothetical protein